MKNAVLAPIIALLVLLALTWTGMFGLSRASSMAAERSSSSTTASPQPTAQSPRDTSDEPDVVADGPAPPDSPGSREETSEREPEGRSSGEQSSRAEREQSSGGSAEGESGRSAEGENARRGPAADEDDSFFSRFTDRETAEARATENNPEDPSGLSNRGAAALLLVLVLIAAANSKR